MKSGGVYRLIDVALDEGSVAARGPDVDHERRIAIFDLLEQNHFEPAGSPGGPYRLRLSLEENRLVFDVALDDATHHGRIILSLTPLRRVIKDYFFVCDSYYQAIRSATPSQIEAIDMGRRGLHNEGSQILMERLNGKIAVDMDTARRLFTLICALHLKL
ncbi:MAG TPA: hypothetical protein DCL54_04945 [Alphaproteobacteria bacterium]|nr:hypothetical protein [Alphaproteobacteria bacterium]HAJ45912.1 hypothetical protein [Alphaproteobacteria bacterium]